MGVGKVIEQPLSAVSAPVANSAAAAKTAPMTMQTKMQMQAADAGAQRHNQLTVSRDMRHARKKGGPLRRRCMRLLRTRERRIARPAKVNAR